MTNPSASGFDVGILSPGTVGEDACVSDGAIRDALVRVERALLAAHVRLGIAPEEALRAFDEQLASAPDAATLAGDATGGGNPVIPLARALKATATGTAAQGFVHLGATSQDVLDSALMLVAREAAATIEHAFRASADRAAALAAQHANDPAAARTLTQHAVPTTIGARFAGWAIALREAADEVAALQFPVQFGGAGGTLAASVDRFGADVAQALPGALAAELGLASAPLPWHTRRRAVTRIGDAIVTAVDAAGLIASEVALLSRPEIGELHEGSPGGSSAMPQKQNPTSAVLLRSLAMRAPLSASGLHLAAALTVDERPDGAWHAEWPQLRELLRIGLGAGARLQGLLDGLQVDVAAARQTLDAASPAIVSERILARLTPVLGADRAREAVGADLATLTAMLDGTPVEVAELVDPRNYLGLAPAFARSVTSRNTPAHTTPSDQATEEQ